MTTTAEREKQEAEDKQQEMIAEVREHLSFVTANLGNVPEQYMSKEYADELRDYISRIRYFLTHGHWEKGEGGAHPPVSYIYNMICRKNGGVAQLTGVIAGPRITGWTRIERQSKEMLKACLIRACNYVPPEPYHPDWLLPWDDPRNTHPAAVRKRKEQDLEVEQSKKDKHAEYMRKTRKKERLEEESKERLKLKKKQRKERKKHFKEQERKRSGKDAE